MSSMFAAFERSHAYLSIHLLFSNFRLRGRTQSDREVGFSLTNIFLDQIWTVVGLSPRALPKCDSRHFCGVGKISRREFASPTFQRHPGSGKKTVGTGSWEFSLSKGLRKGGCILPIPMTTWILTGAMTTWILTGAKTTCILTGAMTTWILTGAMTTLLGVTVEVCIFKK